MVRPDVRPVLLVCFERPRSVQSTEALRSYWSRTMSEIKIIRYKHWPTILIKRADHRISNHLYTL